MVTRFFIIIFFVAITYGLMHDVSAIRPKRPPKRIPPLRQCHRQDRLWLRPVRRACSATRGFG